MKKPPLPEWLAFWQKYAINADELKRIMRPVDRYPRKPQNNMQHVPLRFATLQNEKPLSDF